MILLLQNCVTFFSLFRHGITCNPSRHQMQSVTAPHAIRHGTTWKVFRAAGLAKLATRCRDEVFLPAFPLKLTLPYLCRQHAAAETCGWQRVPDWAPSTASQSYGPTSFSMDRVVLCRLVECNMSLIPALDERGVPHLTATDISHHQKKILWPSVFALTRSGSRSGTPTWCIVWRIMTAAMNMFPFCRLATPCTIYKKSQSPLWSLRKFTHFCIVSQPYLTLWSSVLLLDKVPHISIQWVFLKVLVQLLEGGSAAGISVPAPAHYAVDLFRTLLWSGQSTPMLNELHHLQQHKQW